MIVKILFKFLSITALFFLVACGGNQNVAESETQETETSSAEATMIPVVAAMDEAHKVAAFHQKEAIAFDIELYFGGQKRMESTVYSKTNSSGIRIDRADGATLIYDGKKVYQMPTDAEWPGARFDIFTWQYFFMAPFKFNDPGTNWAPMVDVTMNDQTYASAKLTFESGTGDAPDDWYIAYQDKETNLLEGLAYIVTFGGKEQAEAEAEPHAITYHDYEMVDGIPIAKTWKFWMWTQEGGFQMDKTIGEANITNVRFVDADDLFATPENAAEVTL